MEPKTPRKERIFTVELKSKGNLKNVTLTNGGTDSVLLEGTIGELVEAKFTEGIILEVVGKHGIIRLDLAEDEIRKKEPEQNRIEVDNQ
jgi:hypothetical protein